MECGGVLVVILFAILFTLPVFCELKFNSVCAMVWNNTLYRNTEQELMLLVVIKSIISLPKYYVSIRKDDDAVTSVW